VGEYLDAGSKMVWVVDPEARTITVYRSASQVQVFGMGDTLTAEDVLPGFSTPVAALFE
jgi:Uma2 family endonuclease